MIVVMPASKFRHNLARLRQHLGLDQADVAKLAGCSKSAIQSVELTRLPLSATLAAKLQGALGIESEWLLKNDLNAPIPELLRVYQEGQDIHRRNLEAIQYIAHQIEILKSLSDDKARALFNHYLVKHLEVLDKAFPQPEGPAIDLFETAAYVKDFAKFIEKQRAASLPARQQKVKPLRRLKCSQSRQSV